MLLAIDTSTSLTGLALYEAGGPRAEAAWDSGRNHTAQLLQQLDALLRQIGATQGDLRAVAVALGPGSWSGLRVGMSVAKGIAIAGGLPILGVGTLDALAYQQVPARPPVYPLIRLGRERFATAEFGCRDRLERRGADRNLSLAEIMAEVGERALFCGDLDEAAVAELRAGLGERARFPSPAANLRRPAFLAELAWQRHAAGERDDLTALEPIYLGEPVKPRP